MRNLQIQNLQIQTRYLQCFSAFIDIIKSIIQMESFQNLTYQKGLGNGFSTEAVEGIIPPHQNSPIKLKNGVFAEQLSGTAFTVKRAQNQKVWMYKVRPSVTQGQFKQSDYPFKIIESYLDKSNLSFHPNQLRWKPIPEVKEGNKNFIQGLVSIMGAGQPSLKQGISIYVYSANTSMQRTAFYNSDGDFLIVPHKGVLFVKTLCGKLTVKPKQICVIPRGMTFSIDLQGDSRGWVAELYGHHLSLPELGPIGANGLANPGDFQIPVAWFQDKKQQWKIFNKYIGKMYQAATKFSPFDVVGWRGNYTPFKYDLEHFNTIGSISYDHPDPSIFTVLTCKSAMEGQFFHNRSTATLDFVVFPPRWLVAQNTFKPPYYHRNCMSEFMGNICGAYDAKGIGFAPGCSSLHSCMTPHGPDAQSYQNFVKSQQKPFKISEQNYAFMFESGYLLKTTKWAINEFLQVDQKYAQCWQKLDSIKYES